MEPSVYIVGYATTPVGTFIRNISSVEASSLRADAIKAAIEWAKVQPAQTEEVIFGNILSA
jgi:acetyl-CoA C-acetyltransferase